MPEGTFSTNGGAPATVTPQLNQMLMAATLASGPRSGPQRRRRLGYQGDPTEGALIVAAAKAGLDKNELEAAPARA